MSFAPYAVNERFGAQAQPFSRDEDNVRPALLALVFSTLTLSAHRRSLLS